MTCMICRCKSKIVYSEMHDVIFKSPGQWNIKKCTNPECGLMWVDNVKESDISSFYMSYYTHSVNEHKQSIFDILKQKIYESYYYRKYNYDTNHFFIYKALAYIIFINPIMRNRAGRRILYLPYKNDSLLLDIGCGNGDWLLFMKRLGWNVHGIDIDEQAVEYARGNGLDVDIGDISLQNYTESSYDVIALRHVIEHIYDPHRFLDECYRILKPNGKIILETPNTNSMDHKLFNNHWRGLEPPRHLNLFNQNNLAVLLEKSGFKLVSFTTIPSYHIIFNSIGISNKRSFLSGEFKPSVFEKIYSRILYILSIVVSKIYNNGSVLYVNARKSL